jgi:hypothetical protein
MRIYRNLHGKLEPEKHKPSDRVKTLGGAVMDDVERNRWTAPANLPQITSAFYEQLVAFKWKWTPGRSCGDLEKAASILDGEMVHAECQVAANAFRLLLEVEPPHGFGLDGVKLRTYSGEKSLIGAEEHGPKAKNSKRVVQSNEGFYSLHPLAGVHGLKPNVFDVATNKMAPVYAWTDHKVVEVAGRFYDVCYNTSYENLIDMAIALVLGSNEDTSPTKTIQEAMSRTVEYKVLVKNYFQIAYFRNATPESLAYQLDAKEMGPYAESVYGDEATEMHPYGRLVDLSKWGSNG